jgi:hypothetical protein
VVPQPGRTVLVVNGPHRGAKGALVGIDTKRFQVGTGTALRLHYPAASTPL